MIDPREYNEYIKNAGKSRQVPLVHYDAFSGKPKGELDLAMGNIYYIVGSTLAISFIIGLLVGG